MLDSIVSEVRKSYLTLNYCFLLYRAGSVTKTSNLANFYGGENLWPDSSNWKLSDEDSGDSGNRKSLEGSKTFLQLRSPTCKSPFSTNLLPSPVDPGSAEDALLASLSPEYAEIDNLGTFGHARRWINNLSLIIFHVTLMWSKMYAFIVPLGPYNWWFLVLVAAPFSLYFSFIFVSRM
jgi:hypothetical protein